MKDKSKSIKIIKNDNEQKQLEEIKKVVKTFKKPITKSDNLSILQQVVRHC